MDLQVRRGPAQWIGCAALAFLLGACQNLWEWTVDEESFEALLSEGRQAMRAGEYARAEEKFRAAVAREPANSDARYFLAKAAVLRADIDVFALVRTLTDDSGPSGAIEVFDYDAPKADAIYGANGVVLESLDPIRRGLATEGSFTSKDVELDLSVAYVLRAVLRLRDSNGDGVIDAADLSLADFFLGENEGGFTLEGLRNLTPEQIDAMLSEAAALLSEGGGLLADVLGESGVDVEALRDLTGSLENGMDAYRVNDGTPGNPGEGDNDGDGAVDEECLDGVDEDADGRTDEDARIAGC